MRGFNGNHNLTDKFSAGNQFLYNISNLPLRTRLKQPNFRLYSIPSIWETLQTCHETPNEHKLPLECGSFDNPLVSATLQTVT
jgi:hypothetical protein